MSTLRRDTGSMRWPYLRNVACVLAVSALTACASRMDGAPVVDRSPGGDALATGAPQPLGPPPPGYYRVKPGDTLYRIALENGQNYRDLVSWNNLTNPNQIEVGQQLRVVPPGTAPSAAGVTVTPIAGGPVQGAPLGSSNSAPAYPAPATPLSPTPAASGAAPGPVLPEAAAQTPSAAGLIWPARGPILARFDGNKNKGVDIGGTAGTPIVAAGDGRVLYAGSGLRGYGNLIIIKHSDTLLTAYAHNQTLLVKENDTVTRGQKIAEMGNSGADRVMLHFEVRKQTKPVDPMGYLPPQ